MKQQITSLSSFLLFLLLLVIVFALPMSAQEMSASDAASVTPSVDYTLPYPGILPDNPLYVLKTIRDRVIGWFISDPKNKAQFDLLQADKRLAAALELDKEQPIKEQLLVDTVSKGENYFSEGIGQASLAKTEGIEVNGLLDQLKNAAQKHEQLIKNLENTLSQKDSEQLAFEVTRVQQFEKQVTNLRSH